jgi:hypothetical protein
MHIQALPRLRTIRLLALFAILAPACDPQGDGDIENEDDDELEAQEELDASPASSFQATPKGNYVGFDIERQIDVYDADGDSFPDITEQLAGTDLLDPGSNPGPDGSFPAAACRPGYVQEGPRLCILEFTQNEATYNTASSNCRNLLGSLCTYEDLTYLYLNATNDAEYNPNGVWLGNITGNGVALYGDRSVTFNNDPDILNFEGEDVRTSLNPYWCCHDDES